MSEEKNIDNKMLRLADEGHSQAELAERFGVSRQTAYKRLTELRGRTMKAIAAKKAEDIIDCKIGTMEQLQKINDYANGLLDPLMRWHRSDTETLQILETQVAL